MSFLRKTHNFQIIILGHQISFLTTTQKRLNVRKKYKRAKMLGIHYDCQYTGRT